MSYTFSRRAFLKYSAATAVAVAGASLLGGCEYQDPNNPVSKALPSAITSELQVIGGLRGLKIENGTCTMEVDIESGRANPIPLDPYRFSLAIKDAEGKQVYFSGNNGGVKITDAENSLIVKRRPSRSISKPPRCPTCRTATLWCSSICPSARTLSTP